MHYRVLALAFILLLAAAAPSFAYGKSVEDLVGSFSIGKSIKIGSGSECFSSADAVDPLTPPESAATGALADDQPPSIASFAFQPRQLSAACALPISLTAHLIDDQGVWAAEAAFFGPQGEKSVALFSSQNISSGNAKDGFYWAQMLLPSINETGEWQLHNLTIVDREGNSRILKQKDLQNLGMPTVIRVI